MLFFTHWEGEHRMDIPSLGKDRRLGFTKHCIHQWFLLDLILWVVPTLPFPNLWDVPTDIMVGVIT